MTDLYEILGVEKDAGEHTIKAAYRKLAQKLHPDKDGGDRAKFQAVQEAADVLLDAERRKSYDETGTTAKPGDIKAEARSGFCEMLLKVVDAVDVEHDNVVKETRRFAQAITKDTSAKRASVDSSIKKRDKVIARLTAVGGADPATDALLQSISKLRSNLQDIDRTLAVIAEVVTIIDTYEYMTDEDRTQFVAGPSLGNDPFIKRYFTNSSA